MYGGDKMADDDDECDDDDDREMTTFKMTTFEPVSLNTLCYRSMN
jgi:hypothetical protein